MTTALVSLAGSSVLPAIATAAGDQVSIRSLEFFAGTIRNPHTRRTYGRAVEQTMKHHIARFEAKAEKEKAARSTPSASCK